MKEWNQIKTLKEAKNIVAQGKSYYTKKETYIYAEKPYFIIESRRRKYALAKLLLKQPTSYFILIRLKAIFIKILEYFVRFIFLPFMLLNIPFILLEKVLKIAENMFYKILDRINKIQCEVILKILLSVFLDMIFIKYLVGNFQKNN